MLLDRNELMPITNELAERSTLVTDYGKFKPDNVVLNTTRQKRAVVMMQVDTSYKLEVRLQIKAGGSDSHVALC
jgi:hypothetical protein